MSERAHFSSWFGVVMTFIGVAVGLGNVWRFPYMVSAFGGGAFLIVYLLILVGFGIPALMAEFTLGRLAKQGSVTAFASVGMPGGKAIGWTLFVTVFMATTYYAVIVGWVLIYFLVAVAGQIGATPSEEFFNGLLGGLGGQFAAAAAVLGMVYAVITLGIREGIERVSKFGMPILFLLLLVLIVRTLTLPGAAAGVRFYLLPDFSKIDAGVVSAALGQAFFSLGLGGTFFITYASYLPATTNMKTGAVTLAVGETLAAVLAGLVIVPAAVVFGVEMNSGPPLTFITVPTIFAQMPGGNLFAAMFFGLLFFAALLSAIAAIEVLVTSVVDRFGWSRRKAAAIFCSTNLLAGVISMASLDYITASDLLWGSTMQPLGSAFALIALAWVVGRTRALAEVNTGNAGRPLGAFWFAWIKYVVPAGIFLILATGVVSLFRALLG